MDFRGLRRTSVENYIFWSEIGSRFEEPGGTPPTKNSQEYTPPPPRSVHSTLHMTSPQFKLRNSLLLSFYFHVMLEHLKTFTQKIFGSKWFFVFRYGTLEFPGFCVTRHLAGGREDLLWVKNITHFWRFCYLNIPCLRMNIT